jgi:uncharacterized protein YacL
MGAWVIRVLFFLVCATSGFLLCRSTSSPGPWLGGVAGLAAAGLTLFLEGEVRKVPLKNLLGSLLGLIVGLLITGFIANGFLFTLINQQEAAFALALGLYGIGAYMGFRIGLRKGEEINVSGWKLFSKGLPQGENAKILDTSVIIDGRIADITETGVVDGALLIPQFVLNELQHIADSSDSVKRTRGKRGLEVLHRIQKQTGIDVRIVETDFPAVREVDAKLIEMAKEVRGKIVTNDANLNKVASLQGIQVLNINELANALKPVVLPGEEMNVKVLKEGKEMGQGLAYLDDGTMIVVDNGKRQIGRNIEVVVTSVLQTPAGRMIFARIKDEQGREGRGREGFIPMDSEF